MILMEFGDDIFEKVLSFHTCLSMADKKEKKTTKILNISLDASSIG